MSCYLISFEVADKGDSEKVIQAIKDYGTWAHIAGSLWAVVTDAEAEAVRDDLGQHLPRGSRIIVVKSGVEAAWRKVNCRDEWLKKHL
jgi:hypothetical protein